MEYGVQAQRRTPVSTNVAEMVRTTHLNEGGAVDNVALRPRSGSALRQGPCGSDHYTSVAAARSRRDLLVPVPDQA